MASLCHRPAEPGKATIFNRCKINRQAGCELANLDLYDGLQRLETSVCRCAKKNIPTHLKSARQPFRQRAAACHAFPCSIFIKRPNTRCPSMRRALCSYSLVAQTLMPLMMLAVSSDNARSTYISS